MGSERRGRWLLAIAIAVAVMSVTAPAANAAAWWSPAGLQGTALRSVTAEGSVVEVVTASGQALRSTDRGAHFSTVEAPVTPQVVVTSGQYTWTIDVSGRVLRGIRGGPRVPDPGSPRLGRGAHLIAAPAAFPGVVVAVSTGGTVWRRGHDGDWKQALLLLPQSLVQGSPQVTALAAFAQPLSGAVYLGTAGYAVLISQDGGDDWIRAGPGLPDTVSGLATDSGSHAVYAATTDGLWVHTLQALPAPPRYSDQALVFRWLGIGAVTLVASALAVLAMLRLFRAPRR